MSALGQKRTHAPQQVLLFNQLIGSREKRGRHGETERLSGLQIDHEFKLWSLAELESSAAFSPLRIRPV
jgi:hypothetical protein